MVGFKSRGVVTNSISIINNFILDTYSSGFSILQELIQNANDAKATKAIYSYLPNGLSGAVHPLLKQPLLLAINDGPFLEKDAEAINQLGVGSKSKDSYSIGKFGLGMKSLYHLCDLIFYCTSDSTYAGAINPFADSYSGFDNKHPKWNYTDDADGPKDMALLISEINKLYSGNKTAFCLAIPLRQDNGDEHIRQTFFSNIANLSELFSEDEKDKNRIQSNFVNNLQNMCSILAFTSKTKSLREIDFISPNEKIYTSIKDTRIETSIEGAENTIVTYFTNRAIEVSEDKHRIAKLLQESPSWPRSRLTTSDNDSISDKMDENDCSLIFLKRKHEGRKTLSVLWSSYLPLKKKEQFVEVNLGDKAQYSYCLIFNGAFAIDSGRNGIMKYQDMLKLDFPKTIEELNEKISQIDSQEAIMGLWNSFLFQKVLSPSVPSFLLSALKLPVAIDDFKEILNSFKKDSLVPFRDRATEEEYIVYAWLDSEKKYDWQIERNKNVCIIPEPAQKLMENESFNDFIKLFDTDSVVLLYSTGTAGLYNEKQLKNHLDTIFRDNAIMLDLQEDFIELTADDDFTGFLSNLFDKLSINTDEASDYFDFLKKVLTFNYQKKKQDSKDIKPSLAFKNFINSMSFRLESAGYKFYFIRNDKFLTIDDVVFSWNVQDVPVIIFPSEYGIESCTKIIPSIDAETYIQTIYLPFLRALGSDKAGALFSVLVESFFTSEEQKKDKIPTYFKYLPDDLALMPVTARNHETGVNGNPTYISKREGEGNLFKSVRFHLNDEAFLFYEFAPDAPTCYAMTTSNCQIYGYTALEEFSLMNLLLRYLSDGKYKGKLNIEKAHDVLISIWNQHRWTGLSELNEKKISIFQTTNGDLTYMSQNMGFDLDNIFPDDFKTENYFRIVHIDNKTIKDEICSNKHFDRYVISKYNAFEIYAKCCDEFDSKIVKLLFDKGAEPSTYDVRTRLKDRNWYFDEGSRRKYSCSKMVIADKLPDELVQTLSSECLLLYHKDIEKNDLLKYLDKAGLLVREIKYLDVDVQQSILCSSFSILDADNTSNLNEEEIKKFVSILKNVSEYKTIGFFIGYALQDKRGESLIEEFKRISTISKRSTKSFDQDIFNKILTSISEQYLNEVNIVKSLYRFLFASIEMYSPKLDSALFADTLFPTMAGSLKPLDSLCNPLEYRNIEKEHLIDASIELKHFIKPNVNQSQEAVTADLNTILKIWNPVSKGLIAMLLFITKQKKYRAASFELMNQVNGNDGFFTQYLTAHKPTRESLYDKNYLTASLNEAFAVADDASKETQGRVAIKTSDGKNLNAESICGTNMKLSVDNYGTERSAYSSMSARQNGNTYEVDVTILPLDDLSRQDANKLVIDLMNEVLFILFQRPSHQLAALNYRSCISGIVASNQSSMDVTRTFIRMRMDVILHDIGIGKATPEGALLNSISESINKEVRKKAQLENSNNDQSKEKFEHQRMIIDHKIDDLKKELMRCIEDNPAVSQCVLTSIKNKLTQAQYDETNISFELFQNADDAMNQRSSYDQSDWKGFFKVSKLGNKICYQHNGRPINKYDGRHEEWNRDLNNMLEFSSDKNLSSEIAETGKHGYGFKSCYFISDNPHVYSEQLIAAEIVGGIIPKYIDERSDIGSDTLIELPLNANGKEKAEEILDCFEEQVPGLLLFSLRTDKIIVNQNVYEKHVEFKSDYCSLLNIASRRFLKIDEGKSSIVFNVREASVKGFGDKTIKYWSTTPTRVISGPGYWLNSYDFRIDIGRNQLNISSVKENKMCVLSLARKLASFILALINKDEEVKGLSNSIVLAKDIMRVITSETGDEIQKSIFDVIKDSLSEHGLVYTGNDFIPYDNGVSICALSDSFSSGNRFEPLSKHMKKMIESDSWILVASSLYIPKDVSMSKTINSLKDFIDIILVENQNKMSPEVCDSVLELLAKDCFNSFNMDVDWDHYQYKNEDGRYVDYSSIICPNNDDVFRIAPSENRINSAYDENIYDCFSNHAIDIHWILDADISHRVNALRVLATQSNLIRQIKIFFPYSWVVNEYQEYEDELDEQTYDLLDRLLSDHVVIQNKESDNQQVYGKAYYQIAMNWWNYLSDDVKERYIKRYRKSEFGVEKLDLSSSDNDDWYRLLFISILKGRGRTVQSANIKFVNSFIRNFRQYKDNPLENPEDWMRKIIYDDVYYDSSGESFEDWRKFLPFFAQAVLASDFIYDRFTESHDNYGEFLSFRESSQASGTDFELPNLKKCLGKYYPIILRELLSSDIELDDEVRSSMMSECFWLSGKLKARINPDDQYYNNMSFYKDAHLYVGDDAFETYLDYPLHLYLDKDILPLADYDDKKDQEDRELFFEE